MISVRTKKIVHDLLGNASRTFFVVLSIAVGIFATGAILGARQVLMREFDADFTSSHKASITFAVKGVDQSVVDAVANHGEVVSAEGQLLRYARMRLVPAGGKADAGSSSWESLELQALPSFEKTTNIIEPLNTTAWPPREGEIIIEQAALAVFDYQIGDSVEIDTGTKIARFRIAGFAHDINAIPTRFFKQVTAYTTLSSMRFLGESEAFNIIHVRVDPALSRTEVSRIATDIKETILQPAGITITSTSIPDPGSHFFGDIFKAVSVLLLGMALMSLGLSGFLVITTVSAILIQHTRQIGIMKAIGGRRWQIAFMYFGLVFCFGICALVIGLPSGIAFGRFFINYAASVLNFRVLDYTYPIEVMVLLVGIGLVLPLCAAALPIVSGVKRRIVDAFNANALNSNFGEGWIDRLLGRIGWLPRPTTLALRTTFTRKGRLVLTLITLLLASGVVMAVFSARSSLMKTVEDIGSWWRYDAEIMLSRPAPTTTIEAQAHKIAGVQYVETWMDGYSIINRPDGTKNEKYFTMGYPANSQVIDFQYTHGRPLQAGEQAVVLNNELYKEEEYLTIGDDITLEIAGQQVTRKVVGVVTGSLQGPTLYFERDDLATLMGVSGNSTRALVKMEPQLVGATSGGFLGLGRRALDQSTDGMRAYNQRRIADELEQAFDRKGYAVSDTQTMVLQLDTARGQLGILITFLVIMASALAAVGVIGLSGSMTLSVIESTREIGIMRSIGAGHRSIFGIYITQGLVVGTISWFLGALVSFPISWALMQALIGALGMRLSYRYSFGGVVVCLLLVWIISILGSVLPAWRASQVSIRDAISYE